MLDRGWLPRIWKPRVRKGKGRRRLDIKCRPRRRGRCESAGGALVGCAAVVVSRRDGAVASALGASRVW